MSRVLGLLGGTFDPVHYGHLRAADAVRRTLGLAEVRLFPAGDPPHRAAPVATASHRVAMLELALPEFPGLVLDAREIARPGKSYTVLTLAELRAEDPMRPLALIVGSDAFLGLPTWHRWTELFDLAHVVVVTRPDAPLDGVDAGPLAPQWARRLREDASVLETAPAGAIFVLSIPPQPISASAIRRALAAGPAGLDALRGMVPPAVLAYIDRNQLYRSRPDGT
ncbi:MAG TPA: nicotinate-nucleotide adenylyltransferase [Casimicrobiaceae bacterium]|nr:nicotinate-nucleotide adenylyltransferase [Casimicrobiaceae bacterium]